MTSATTTPEETTWISDFGPIPYGSLDLEVQQYEVRSYWLADFRIKSISEALAFAAKFDSPEVFSAYMDIKGDEGYVYFEIKANTRPMATSLRYAADRWSAVDGRAAHTRLKNPYSDETLKSRGVLTVFHAFLDEALLEKVCEQLDITKETQSKLLARINFREKTYSLVASEEAASDFPPQKPYKTSIIPKSPIKAGESMNAQEETAEATTNSASIEPSATETAASGSQTDSEAATALSTAQIDSARAEILAWATGDETPAESTSEPSGVETQPPVQTAVESAPPAGSAPIEAPSVELPSKEEVETPAEPAAEAKAEVEAPVHSEPAATVETVTAESSPVEPIPSPEAPVQEVASEAPAQVEEAEKTETATSAPEQAAPAESKPAEITTPAAAEVAQEPAKKQEMWRTPAEIRAEKPPSQNAAKTSDSGVLGKLAAKSTDQRGRDKKDNRDRSEGDRDQSRSNSSSSSQGRTNFAPQNNRSLEAPRPVENTPKYHTYSQSEVDNLIKKSAENVTNSVSSKINKQTKVVEDSLKNQDFAFKQALEKINKQSEDANQKLAKAVAELNAASSKQRNANNEAFEKEIEEFKSQINKKVSQGIKTIDSKLEQLSEVKKPKPAQEKQKAAPARGPNINPNLLFAILGLVVLLTLGNIIVSFNAFERIATLESALKIAKPSSTDGEVPIPDLMKDQVNKETPTTPAPVQP